MKPSTIQSYSYPSQMVEVIDGITFTSCFDSGNLGSVKKDLNIKNKVKTYLTIVKKYLLTIKEDSGVNGKTTSYRTWFYFAVLYVKQGNQLTFTITNMNNHLKLFKEGMVPVFRNTKNTQWQRLILPIAYQTNSENQLEVTFRHQFEGDDEDGVYFAFTYPWSTKDNTELLRELELEALPEVYFNRSTLILSREGRRIDLVTITSSNGLQDVREQPIQNLFPEGNRPHLFSDKKYIFISARVHPGEVPSSHLMNGFLKYLTKSQNQDAEAARSNFVWVFLPLLNPDGVYRGHYRTDPWCLNLNRYYQSPSLNEHPSVWAVREYIMRLHQTGRLYAYIDLHAHASHKGIFIYGNSLPTLQGHTLSCLLPKLISMYSEIFDYEGCNFTEKNMHAADKSDGLSKDGAGRVALYKATNLIHSYTLECNYNTGRFINKLSQESYVSNEEIQTTYGSNIIDIDNVLNAPSYNTIPETYFYKPSDYEEVGKAIITAFTDLNLVNPISRLPQSQFKTLQNLKLHMAVLIMKQLPFRFDNFIRKVIKNLNAKEQISRTIHALREFVDTNIVKDSLDNENQNGNPTRYQRAQELKQKKIQEEEKNTQKLVLPTQNFQMKLYTNQSRSFTPLNRDITKINFQNGSIMSAQIFQQKGSSSDENTKIFINRDSIIQKNKVKVISKRSTSENKKNSASDSIKMGPSKQFRIKKMVK